MAVAARGPSCFDRSVMVRYERTGPREAARVSSRLRSEEHTSELQSQSNLVCRLLLEKKKKPYDNQSRKPYPRLQIDLRVLLDRRRAQVPPAKRAFAATLAACSLRMPLQYLLLTGQTS